MRPFGLEEKHYLPCYIKKEPCVKQRMLSGLMMAEDCQQISEASRMLSRSSKVLFDESFFSLKITDCNTG